MVSWPNLCKLLGSSVGQDDFLSSRRDVPNER